MTGLLPARAAVDCPECYGAGSVEEPGIFSTYLRPCHTCDGHTMRPPRPPQHQPAEAHTDAATEQEIPF